MMQQAIRRLGSGEGRTTVSVLAAETTFELTRGGARDAGGPERVEVVAAITGA